MTGLATHYTMSFEAVLEHVAILEPAGPVGKHRMGRRTVVHSNPERLSVARRLFDRYENLWRERVALMNQVTSHAPKEADL